MPAGRPTTLTPELLEQICEHVSHGNYHKIAAKVCGVSPRTLRNWIALGKERPDSLHGEFVARLAAAEAEAEILAAAAIHAAGKDDVDHFKWWLERKAAQRWGRNRVELAEVKKRLDKLEGDHAKSPPAG